MLKEKKSDEIQIPLSSGEYRREQLIDKLQTNAIISEIEYEPTMKIMEQPITLNFVGKSEHKEIAELFVKYFGNELVKEKEIDWIPKGIKGKKLHLDTNRFYWLEPYLDKPPKELQEVRVWYQIQYIVSLATYEFDDEFLITIQPLVEEDNPHKKFIKKEFDPKNKFAHKDIYVVKASAIKDKPQKLEITKLAFGVWLVAKEKKDKIKIMKRSEVV